MSDINETVRAAIDEACTASADLIEEVRRLREENEQIRAAHLALAEQHAAVVRERDALRSAFRERADVAAYNGQVFEAADIAEMLGEPTRSEQARAAAVADLERQIAEQRADRSARPMTFDELCATRLADEVAVLVRRRVIDARSPAADALLDYRDPPSTPRADRLAELERQIADLRARAEKAELDVDHYVARVAAEMRRADQAERERDEWRVEGQRVVDLFDPLCHKADPASMRMTAEAAKQAHLKVRAERDHLRAAAHLHIDLAGGAAAQRDDAEEDSADMRERWVKAFERAQQADRERDEARRQAHCAADLERARLVEIARSQAQEWEHIESARQALDAAADLMMQPAGDERHPLPVPALDPDHVESFVYPRLGGQHAGPERRRVVVHVTTGIALVVNMREAPRSGMTPDEREAWLREQIAPVVAAARGAVRR